VPIISSITVYCSSSSAVAPVYVDAAIDLGRAIALNNWTLVYGGNSVGLMEKLADSVRANKGKVIGVTPQLFIDKGVHDTLCDEFIVTECMRTRKAEMEARGDAYIAMPGGLGTLEEILEIIVGKQLKYHSKPIVLLNIADYYQPMLDLIERGIEQNFIKSKARNLFFVAADVESAVTHIRDYVPPAIEDKWFDKSVPNARTS
jgi:cytokinin riboside 5'-monophosphate phosphoribohydrolase